MLSNKNTLNIVIVVLFLIILATLVSKKYQENFVDIQLLDIKSGIKGDIGASGIQGPPGPTGVSGTSYMINENNMYIKDNLKLGTNNLVYVSPDKNNHYSQLKLSKKINPNGIKLKISSSNLHDYIRAETKDTTDFILKHNKMTIEGDFELSGSLSIRDNNTSRKFPNDIIPIGTIFPFYFKNASKFVLCRGYYNITDLTDKPIKSSLELGTSIALEDNTQKCFISNIENNIYTIQINQDYLVYNKNGDLEIGAYNEDYSKFFINFDRNTENQYVIQSVNTDVPNYLNTSSNSITLDTNSANFKIIPTIPPGWKPCTGSGTITYTHNNNIVNIQVPNLSEKFILNYDQYNFPLGSEGGRSQIDIREAHIPTHTHQMGTVPPHTHLYSGGNEESHTHNINLYNSIPQGSQGSSYVGFVGGDPDQSFTTLSPFTFDSAGGHAHNISISNSGSHSHRFNAFGSTSVTSIELEPNYMELIYIIKAI
jgi:microcystin-dependent protein